MNLFDIVKNAGIVGAGGAGFPTHIKLSSKVEIVIINGIECEPLIKTDLKIMTLYAKEIVSTLNIILDFMGAEKGIIAVKKKHEDIIEEVQKNIDKDSRIEIFETNSFYPAGDEQILVYETTQRIVPEGGIPVEVGVVVFNVTTIYNIYNALKNNNSVYSRPLTIAGEVKHPIITFLPIGITLKEAIDLAGGAKIDNFVVLIGGPMMGYITEDLNNVITKTMDGIIVLPGNHFFVLKKTQELSFTLAQGKSACEQCFRCTEICPRYLMGHSLEPHKMMRQTQLEFYETAKKITTAFLCSECGLCSLYACPQGLLPYRYYQEIKKILNKANIKNPNKKKPLETNRLREYRKVSTSRITSRIGLEKYDIEIPFVVKDYIPKTVKILLKQHSGTTAVPIVKKNDTVKSGQLIADIMEDKIGARIHSSIAGKITEITDNYIKIENY